MSDEEKFESLERARRAFRIFELALDLDLANQAGFVARECGADSRLHDEVTSLLHSSRAARTCEILPSLSRTTLGSCTTLPSTSPSTPPSFAPGDRIGRYLVLGVAAAGGMGTVYLAHDTTLDRKVALKVLHASPSDASASSRLLAEATAMARLAHPNVVTVHDAGTFSGQTYVAMEYVTGVTLSDWRRRKARSVREILSVMADVARGVEAAHAVGIVHRDIKPTNVLVAGERALVTDFGLSTREGEGSGMVAGTPEYMAPEQFRGEPATRTSDIFSFCATLFEMLYGCPPFGIGSAFEVQSRVAAGQKVRVQSRLGIPLRVQRLVAAGLSVDPAERPGSIGEVEVVLRSNSTSPRRTRWLATITGAALIAAWVSQGATPESTMTPQAISGPAWVQPPQPVVSSMFGVTLNSETGAMPDFRVGAVRLWDSNTRWASIEQRRGEFDWTTLDRLIHAADHSGLPVLFTLGGTPPWAAPSGARGPYRDGSRASPPDDLSDWSRFIAALVARYHDRIQAYEVWVLGNDPRFFAGEVETLIEMTRMANDIIKAAAPSAKVVCPGMGRLWTREGQEIFSRFAALGGYQHCDVASIKLYQRSPADPPETMLSIVERVERVLHRAGVQPPIWNTGTHYEIARQAKLDGNVAENYAVRFFLVSLYARLGRSYFYSWGGTKVPIVLQAEGGAPTPAARAVERLQGWLAHANIRSCGQGEAFGLPKNAWGCSFTLSRAGRSYQAAIRWTHRGTASVPVIANSVVHTLQGEVSQKRVGEPVTLTEQPVLIEDSP